MPTPATQPQHLAILAVLLGLALPLAACGGSAAGGVASIGSHARDTAGGSPAAGPSASGSSSASGGSGEAGGSGGASVQAQIGGEGGGAGAQDKMLAFARCMRTHGVSGFPEPVEGKIVIRGGPHTGVDPRSSQFQAAQRACRAFAPQQTASPAQASQFQAKALRFSACMRSHGVPGFPDPKISGGAVQLTINRGSGIDPRSPQFQAAQRACQSQMPGGGAKTSGGPPPPGAP